MDCATAAGFLGEQRTGNGNNNNDNNEKMMLWKTTCTKVIRNFLLTTFSLTAMLVIMSLQFKQRNQIRRHLNEERFN